MNGGSAVLANTVAENALPCDWKTGKFNIFDIFLQHMWQSINIREKIGNHVFKNKNEYWLF